MKVGERLIALRQQRGFTTNRLANLCGLSQSFVRSVELGEKGITVENLELLCDALQISLRDFFDIPKDAPDGLTADLLTCISNLTTEQKRALITLLSRR